MCVREGKTTPQQAADVRVAGPWEVVAMDIPEEDSGEGDKDGEGESGADGEGEAAYVPMTFDEVHEEFRLAVEKEPVNKWKKYQLRIHVQLTCPKNLMFLNWNRT